MADYGFNVMNDLEKIRNEYLQKSFTKEEAASDPFQQFKKWFDEVLAGEVSEPTACTLSTADRQGRPSGRIVLLKGYDDQGFRFFTNYNSRKGREMDDNPFVALTFFWKELERQVRISGRVNKLNDRENNSYFNSRPAGSRIGAWASPQSEIIPDRRFLEASEEKYVQQFGEEIPRPDHWGGYELNPDQIEFWQGRANRLHDRIQYARQDDRWVMERLAP